MSKKISPQPITEIKEAYILEQPISEALELNYMPYAMSVIVSRAIPEIDGFKPAHRKLLYTMYKMGLLTGGRIKSANIVGQTMRLNPHGDAAIYETLVRLTKGNDALLHPFIDSKGNFGKNYSRDMAFAASRYTEVKLDTICEELFKDIDKNVVAMVDNYDSTMLEPALLPTTFPNLLVTPNQGIAVGMASSVCSFNLKEICTTMTKWITNPNIDIMSTLPAPDFSSGGQLLYKEQELRAIYKTGRGSFKLRAKYRHDEKNSCIEIYEIPYTTTIEAIIDKVATLVKTGKLREISDIRDETDLQGLKIAIDVKRNVDTEKLMHKLFNLTTLQDSFSCNFNFLINARPRTMGITEIFAEWLIFRTECIKKQTLYDIEKKTQRGHLLMGLSAVMADIDTAIKIVRQTSSEDMVISNLMENFNIDQPQAEFIAEMRLRNLNREYLLKQIAEFEQINQQIAELAELLQDEDKIKKLIITQLQAISKKYGIPRKTEIIFEEEQPVFEEDSFIEDYNLKLFLTADGYLKKISLVSLRSASEQYLKEGDTLLQELDTSNKADVLFFTDMQNAYKVKAHELPDTKASALGEYLANHLELAPAEKVIYMIATTDYSGFVLFGYKNGKVAKVPLNSYDVRRKKLLKAYSDKFPLIAMFFVQNSADLYLTRGTDKAMLVDSDIISPISSRTTGGVQVFTLRKNMFLTAFEFVEKVEKVENIENTTNPEQTEQTKQTSTQAEEQPANAANPPNPAEVAEVAETASPTTPTETTEIETTNTENLNKLEKFRVNKIPSAGVAADLQIKL
ncbi:MAG: DNA topoisomerase (ATP-hydrolyzing) subunit A [Defluviitaleaceae bacterium]|nr:DNA topoisomerase (ATP-hydrolyzing) subunit A [Defluviitaleaceae bacterium]